LIVFSIRFAAARLSMRGEKTLFKRADLWALCTKGCGMMTVFDRVPLSEVKAWKRGAWACVKPMPNRKKIPAFSPFLYRYRNLVERFFNKLKHFRAIATRYDKRDDNFLASVQLASIRIWLRHNESVS